jgi:hypothetical protein
VLWPDRLKDDQTRSAWGEHQIMQLRAANKKPGLSRVFYVNDQGQWSTLFAATTPAELSLIG